MTPAPDERSVHVWRIDVRQPAEALRELRALLAPDEEERAARFRFDRDRDAFVATRAALRCLAGSYLGLAPRKVAFAYAPKGKPWTDGISFNVSHAGDVALAAFTRSCRVGVDVEEMRPGVDLGALARRFFSPAENRALGVLENDAFVTAFYRCWTRKEAFVKALGEGLSFDLDRVDVSVGADARLLSVDAAQAGGWWIADVSPRDGYAGAVVADLRDAELTVREWPGLVTAAV
ncbi:MAG: 4'-phosphopantetheinyl transferase superfamily protein [Actinomycetota bacterium]|nr:4'-phosphopantetheinyl transferase superfamily protein [Actinomycetota bacterium]